MEKDVRTIEADGIKLVMTDVTTSAVRDLVRKDLDEDIYGLRKIPWKVGDQVIDVGANIGMVSIYLAKKYPYIKSVFACEPMPENFDSLVKNIKLNEVQDIVIPVNSAVTADGRQFEMIAHLASNTGGATGFLQDMNLPEHQKALVHSITLEEIFRYCIVGRCKLLKMDCEGAEHEIIECSETQLRMVDYLSAELHINGRLERAGYSIEGTIGRIRSSIAESRLRIHTVRMAD